MKQFSLIKASKPLRIQLDDEGKIIAMGGVAKVKDMRRQ